MLLCLCPQCFQRASFGEPPAVAIGPNSFAAPGGVAVGNNAKAMGVGALALGDNVTAQPGEKNTGETIFGVPLTEAMYPPGSGLDITKRKPPDA